MLKKLLAISTLLLAALAHAPGAGGADSAEDKKPPFGDPRENRVLQHFDFEERQRGNLEDVPVDWVKVEGPGLPHYVDGKLATDDVFAGKYSFKMSLNGGSVIYRDRKSVV